MDLSHQHLQVESRFFLRKNPRALQCCVWGGTTITKFALLGKDQTTFETKIETLLAADLGVDAEKIQNVTLLAVVWDGCRSVKEFKLAQTMRPQEDPH